VEKEKRHQGPLVRQHPRFGPIFNGVAGIEFTEYAASNNNHIIIKNEIFPSYFSSFLF